MNLKLTKQSKIILLSLFGIALLGGVGYGGWRYWESRRPAAEPQSPVVEPTPIIRSTDDPDWNLYISEEYGFSVEYPAEWEVKRSLPSVGHREDLRMKSWIKFMKVGSAYAMISTWELPGADLLEWSKENKNLLVSGGAVLPAGANARVAGLPALVLYSPPGQAPSKVTAVLKNGDYIFRIEHFTPKNESPLLWDIYEHFLRTFEFEGTENIPDELPEFPMGF